MHRLVSLSAVSLVVLLVSSACAAGPGGPAPISSDAPAGESLGSLMPAAPETDVVGAGTVLDVDGDVQLCLGPVMESYPPQCGGTPISGWSWDGVEGSEQSGDVRWGAYAVTGTYDGETFAVSGAPVPLALYDPMVAPDPTGGRPGDTAEADLPGIQDEVQRRLNDPETGFLGAMALDGYVWVDVVWDDGTLQQAADDDFGPGVVMIRSALRAVE